MAPHGVSVWEDMTPPIPLGPLVCIATRSRPPLVLTPVTCSPHLPHTPSGPHTRAQTEPPHEHYRAHSHSKTNPPAPTPCAPPRPHTPICMHIHSHTLQYRLVRGGISYLLLSTSYGRDFSSTCCFSLYNS